MKQLLHERKHAISPKLVDPVSDAASRASMSRDSDFREQQIPPVESSARSWWGRRRMHHEDAFLSELTPEEWNRIYLGTLPDVAMQAAAHERMLISSLDSRWERAIYCAILADRAAGSVGSAAAARLPQYRPGLSNPRIPLSAWIATCISAL